MDVPAAASAARQAARRMLGASDPERQAAVRAVADALEAAADTILAANRRDLEANPDLDPALRQRLELPAEKLATTIDGMRQVAALPDPVGQTLRTTELADGLTLWQQTVPLGVIACIFESRPDVCIQIPALTLRTANAVLLKGGKEAHHTVNAITDVIRDALATTALPADAVQALPDREAVAELLALDGLVDLIIPRGSNALVRHIQENTHIPVMGHAAGICHVYVDAEADLEKAKRIIIDAKTDYPSACNAVETLLVHDTQRSWFDQQRNAFEAAGVVFHEPGDFDHEYGSTELNLRFVADLDAAIQHINDHGSGHTDCIITEDKAAMRRFLSGVDAAGVYVNASTRFADGYRYGLGAEVGISTGKLHARGPVGLDGLVSTRWVLIGAGHTAGDFKQGGFIHRPVETRLSETLQ